MLVELEMSVELSHWLICLGFESKVFSSCQSLLDPDDDRVSGTQRLMRFGRLVRHRLTSTVFCVFLRLYLKCLSPKCQCWDRRFEIRSGRQRFMWPETLRRCLSGNTEASSSTCRPLAFTFPYSMVSPHMATPCASQPTT